MVIEEIWTVTIDSFHRLPVTIRDHLSERLSEGDGVLTGKVTITEQDVKFTRPLLMSMIGEEFSWRDVPLPQ